MPPSSPHVRSETVRSTHTPSTDVAVHMDAHAAVSGAAVAVNPDAHDAASAPSSSHDRVASMPPSSPLVRSEAVRNTYTPGTDVAVPMDAHADVHAH